MTRNAMICAAIGALSIALLAGCRDSTGPVPVGTMFVLVQIGGDALPTAPVTWPGGVTVIADTLLFDTEASGHSGIVEEHETQQYPSGTDHLVDSLSYDWRDGVLTLHLPPCPLGAFCVRFMPETGRLDGSTLTMKDADSSIRIRTYHRVS
jgi:hypothetical protein